MQDRRDARVMKKRKQNETKIFLIFFFICAVQNIYDKVDIITILIFQFAFKKIKFFALIIIPERVFL